MARKTSLEKFLEAVDPAVTGLTVATAPSPYAKYWDRGGELTVSVMDYGAVTEKYTAYLDVNSYRIDRGVVGYEAYFTASGKFLGANALYLASYADGRGENRGKATATYMVHKNSGGRRAEYFHRVYKDVIEAVAAVSPAVKASKAAAAAAAAEERVAEEAARVARVKAIKPDVRSAAWRVSGEYDRSLGEYTSSLKSIISSAERLLERVEETGYVYESDSRHLATIVADLIARGAKASALKEVINSELAPIFEGSPWED